jgi:hypothetical protein
VLAACLLALAAVALALVQALPTLRTIDVTAHLTPRELGTGERWWMGVFAGTRPLDFANVLFGLSPLALVAMVWLPARGRPEPARRALGFFAVLAGSWLLGMLAVHPIQGYTRDYDDVAGGVAAMGLLAAWLLGERLEGSSAGRWLAAPIIGAAVSATVLWLMVPTDPDRGLARVRAFVSEPPTHAPEETSASWAFLGMNAMRQQHIEESAHALAEAAKLLPTPTTLRKWALAEAQAGHLELARTIYRRLLERDPRNVMAWYSLAAISSQLGDYPESARALRRVLALYPTAAAARENLQLIEQYHPEARSSGP